MNESVPPQLPPELVARIAAIKAAVDEVYPKSMEDWLHGFAMDWRPAREIFIWECMAFAYASFVDERDLPIEYKMEVLTVLMHCSFGKSLQDLAKESWKQVDAAQLGELFNHYEVTQKVVRAIHLANQAARSGE